MRRIAPHIEAMGLGRLTLDLIDQTYHTPRRKFADGCRRQRMSDKMLLKGWVDTWLANGDLCSSTVGRRLEHWSATVTLIGPDARRHANRPVAAA